MLPRTTFAARRARFLEMIGPRGVALFVAPPEAVRSNDGHYVYRPSNDIIYLTGFEEPECALLLSNLADKERFVMFVRPRDPEREVWDGHRAGPDGAIADYGADAAYPIGELPGKLAALIAGADEVHFSLGQNRQADVLLAGTIDRMRLGERRLGRPPRAVVNPRHSLHELRLHKTRDDIDALSRACAVTAEAHLAAMRAARPGVHEYELAALLEYTFGRRGGAAAYPPIVGAGANATVLHYIQNRAPLAAGELVLIDAGCELDWYAADVTRTFPSGGGFSGPQREIYDLVLAAQDAAIQMTRPGITLDEMHDKVVAVLTAGLCDLGILDGKPAERIADGAYKKYYMHRTSHWLGLDVHDVGLYTGAAGARPLEAGMVITIEPGLYIAAGDTTASLEWRGIGVRIEDDVLVLPDGHRVLTDAIPKAPGALERIVGTG